MRPRYGLLRGREFIMKDLYTFDTSEEEALRTYEEVLIAYKNIFDRIRVPFVIVSFSFNKELFLEILVIYYIRNHKNLLNYVGRCRFRKYWRD